MKFDIQCFFDGAVAPVNPGGHGGYGIAIFCEGRVVFSDAVYVGRWPELSNNCTEYAGAIGVLRWLIQHDISTALVKGDADLVINQLNGKWKAKRGAYLPFYQEAWALRQKLPNVKFEWIPREMNTVADDLSKQAVSKRPLVVGFSLDKSVQLVAPAVILKRPRTRDLKRQYVLIPEGDDDAAIEEFRGMYG